MRETPNRMKMRNKHEGAQAPYACRVPMQCYAKEKIDENDCPPERSWSLATSNISLDRLVPKYFITRPVLSLLHLRGMIDSPNAPYPSTRLPHAISTRRLSLLPYGQAPRPTSAPTLFCSS